MSDTPRTKPTLAELEKLLARDDVQISMLPDGSIVVNDRIAELETALAAMKAERDAAVKDAERFDWAQDNPVAAYSRITAQWLDCGRGCREHFFNFRHAIDAAIAARKP